MSIRRKKEKKRRQSEKMDCCDGPFMKLKPWHALLFYFILALLLSRFEKICNINLISGWKIVQQQQQQLWEKLGEKLRERGEKKKLTLASSGEARRSVTDLKAAVCCCL